MRWQIQELEEPRNIGVFGRTRNCQFSEGVEITMFGTNPGDDGKTEGQTQNKWEVRVRRDMGKLESQNWREYVGKQKRVEPDSTRYLEDTKMFNGVRKSTI